MSHDITATPEATLTIKQMAALSGMSEYTLRYYEKIGLIQPIPRDGSSGHRRYSAATAQLVEALACLRASGLSLDDMRRYLRLRERGDEAAAEQKALFVAHAEEVAEEIRQLTIRQRYLSGKVAYWTDWGGPSAKFAKELPAYDHVREATSARSSSAVRGNPEATGPVVLKLVDMEQPPLRIFFGKGAHDMIHAEYDKRLAEWDQFKDLSEEAHGELPVA